ncbi:MAG: hypothetical protein ACKVOU_05785 [Cytophagales bacterium]
MKLQFILASVLTISVGLYCCTSQNAANIQPKTTVAPTDTVPSVVSLSINVKPIFSKYGCTGSSCHGGNSSSGGVFLGSHNGIKIVAQNGRLYNAIAHINGADPMPSSSQKMNDLELTTVKKWIDNGALDN